MLIMHVIVGLGVGGAELMLKRLIESHQSTFGCRHSVISLTDLGKIGEQLQDQGVEVCALDMRSLIDIPHVLLELMRQIRSSRPSIVQTWMYHADLLGGLAALMAGNRQIIWGIRTTDVKAGGSRITALIRKMCAVLSYRVPRTIVCAAESSRQAHAAVGYDSKRMVVIPNGFDLARLVATAEQREILRSECGFAAEHIVIGSLGRFHPAKDQHNFVRAAGLLADRFPHVRFLMIGRQLDGTNEELGSWIAETGHDDRFVLLGERADAPICLAAMDVFCLHSRNEGFPNVLGEAMAMGLPCVATDVGDAAMLLADTGIVVPRDDSAALAQGVGRILEMESDDRKQLGQEAMARIHSDFTMDRACERFEAIYKQVMVKEVH